MVPPVIAPVCAGLPVLFRAEAGIAGDCASDHSRSAAPVRKV
jgi:hypothetical protein